MDRRRANEEDLDGGDGSVPRQLWRLPQLFPPPYHSDLRSSAAASGLCMMAPAPWRPSSINTNLLGARFEQIMRNEQRRDPVLPVPGIYPDYTDHQSQATPTRISCATTSSGNADMMFGVAPTSPGTGYYPCAHPASHLHANPERVVRLLELGAADDELRLSLLNKVERNAHRFMLQPRGAEVFKALVRCCQERHEELLAIVQGVVHPDPRRHQVGQLRQLLTHDSRWVDCMKVLISVLSKHNSHMCDMIVEECMQREDLDVMSIGNGHNLLSHCFSTLNCLQIESLIKHAVEGIDKNPPVTVGMQLFGGMLGQRAGRSASSVRDHPLYVDRQVSLGMLH